MDHKDDYDEEHQYPQGYEYLNEMTDEATKQIKELDERIKSIPTESISQIKLRLQYHPFAMGKSVKAFENRDSREGLEEQIKQVETKLMTKIDRFLDASDADPEEARGVKKVAIARIYPGAFKDATKKELERARPMEKDPQYSQDFMLRIRADERKRFRNREVTKSEPTKEKATKPMSMSDKFSAKLSYTKYAENQKDVFDRAPKGKSSIEPGKD